MLNYHNYRDFNTVNQLILNNLTKIPTDIDLVVGIPRSGLVVSTMIAEYTNLPSTDMFSYLANVGNYKLNSGSYAPSTNYATVKRILLVDDAMGVGITMDLAKQKIKTVYPEVNIITCVAFVEPASTHKVDIFFEQLCDQFLPWSILKRGISDACCDIDGVLTEDVPPECDDDGDAYVHFLEHQRPKFRPDRPINTLVTGRLSKYKEITINWLARHNIQYGNLIMCPLETKQERDQKSMGAFKAFVFSKSPLPLFIESDLNEARIIKHINQSKSVYCVSLGTYV